MHFVICVVVQVI